MQQDGYVRSYTKNDFYTGNQVATKLWVGDYATEDTFEGFAQKAEGIERIGVLRADVDNLGTTFVYGFQRPDGSHKYVTLSRTATLSRQLSLFFKCYINSLLREGEAGIFAGKGKRNAAIVYSGGDDVFLVGAWNEVIAAFQELKNALARFAQGTLTISGGIGVYPEKYPLNVMAKEVERLEDAIPELDILYMTRVQKERFFNEEDYVRMKDFYILDKQKLSLAKDDMYILHPLPRVNEISVEVDSDPRAAYFKQAQYGVYVRMALILTLLEVELPC